MVKTKPNDRNLMTYKTHYCKRSSNLFVRRKKPDCEKLIMALYQLLQIKRKQNKRKGETFQFYDIIKLFEYLGSCDFRFLSDFLL